MRKITLLVYTILCCIALSYSQTIKFNVTGTITVNDVATQNVSIKLRQSNTTAIADVNGRFTIAALFTFDTLEISSNGFLPLSISVSNRTQMPLVIKLTAASKDLEEVVVNTGYQKLPKERSTGSFTTINKTILNQQSGTTLLDRLESISNGLYFDRQTIPVSGPKIIIRGLSTIKGPSSALIIVDNFPYEDDVNNINPNDVESITILKDAAAASIWGTKAGNGVIVITTKKGRFEQPIKVELNSTVLLTQKPDLDYLKMISPAGAVQTERYLYDKGFYSTALLSQPWTYTTPVVETLYQRDKGIITPAKAEEMLAAMASHDLKNDLENYVYQTGINLQQSLGISGGSKNIAWNFNAGWDHNTDILQAKYNRYSFRNGETFKVTKQLELSIDLDYTQSENTGGKSSYALLKPVIGSLSAYTQLADANGNALPVNNKYRQAYTDTLAGGNLLDWRWYPLTDYQNVSRITKLTGIIGNISLDYKFKNGISLSVKYQYGNQQKNDEIINGLGSYYTRDLINQYTTISAGKLTYNIPKGAIVDKGHGVIETSNIRGQINYNRQFSKYRIDAIAGGEYRQIDYDYTSQRIYGFNANNLASASVNYTTVYQTFPAGSNVSIPGAGNISGTLNRYISAFSNAAVTYHNKYTLSGSMRRDASNLFGATSNNRWTPLWSTGASWDISKEPFYKWKLFPVLKFRMSYGYSGNADPLRSGVTVISYNSLNSYTQLPTANITQFANPGLSWEKVATTNVGIDFTSKNTRLFGSIEYYYKKATNLFGTTPVDYTVFPASTIIKNVASIAAYGWDFNLNSRNTIGKINWSSQLNLSFNKDKVLKYYLSTKQGSNFVSGNSVSAIEGNPVYALYCYRWGGLDSLNGDPIGYINGAKSKDYSSILGGGTQIQDLVYFGPTLPTVTASLGNTVSWKKWSLTLRITGKFGHYFLRSSIDYTQLFSFRNGHSDYTDRWQKPGDELHTNVPSIVYPNNSNRINFYSNAEILATKADLIRLQYITLSYTLSRPAIQFYCNANNLGLIWTANKYGIDPEYNSSIPPSLNIAFGVRATF